MILLSVTDFSRKLKAMLDLVEYKGEEIILTRNKHKIARITPEAVTPVSRPMSISIPAKNPTRIGKRTAITPGSSMSFKAEEVLMSTHFL